MSGATPLLLVMGATILAVRSFAFVFAERIALPALLREALELALPAILAALLASGLLFDHETGTLDVSPRNPYLLAGFLTIAMALRVKSFFWLTLLGTAAFALLRAVL